MLSETSSTRSMVLFKCHYIIDWLPANEAYFSCCYSSLFAFFYFQKRKGDASINLAMHDHFVVADKLQFISGSLFE